jgi:membrane protease subunit HflK
MAWNEPPGGNKGRDPWGNRGNNEGPPDLDELVRKLQDGLGGLFGRRRSIGGGPGVPPMVLVGALAALAVIVLLNVTHLIDQQERGVQLRFGRYVTTLQPGLNFTFPPPIDQVIKLNVGQVRSITHKSTMLTQDENIVDVEVAVQWKIGDPSEFIFNLYSSNLYSPVDTLRQVAESAVREIIGKHSLDFVLTEGRSEIAQQQHLLMQQILNDYQAGIVVVTVEMQPAKPPEAVKAAFDDAIKSREDEQRLVNEAEAYRNDIIPKARGAAARMREESNGYKATVIARAEGEAARFEQLLAEYERAPVVTRQRLYLDSIESVLGNTSKVLDTKGGNNLMYLPLDKMFAPNPAAGAAPAPAEFGRGVAPAAVDPATRDPRSRPTR